MSSNLPPSQPPYDAHPPSEPPAAEVLDHRDGTAMAAAPRSGSGGRKGLLIGGGVVGLALVGGGAWAAMSFFSTGAQPAEALPETTLGYASIDLDPSGGQKIEALQTLNKFPGFEDKVGLDSDDDLRKSLFDAIQKDGGCPGPDFSQDIEPWLGDRAAIAAVKDADGSPQPVVVVQVKDAGAAETGLKTLEECAQGEAGEIGWVIEGDWAVVSATDALAQSVSEGAAQASLADDETFQKWTGETGDPGIVTLYAAPSAGATILEQLGESAALPDEVRSQFADFTGLAATIRFADGALEFEAAGGSSTVDSTGGTLGTASVTDQVASLPDDTAATLGLSLQEGWSQRLLDQIEAEAGGAASTDDLLAQAEAASGLSLPEDLETLAAGGVVLSVGPDLDSEAIANSTDLSTIPAALKLGGDPEAIADIIDTLNAGMLGGVVGTTTAGDSVVVGPSQDYREDVAAGGELGDTEEFADVVGAGDSPYIFFINVNALEPAVKTFAGGDDEVLANIEPLSAIGVSTSQDGDISRVVLRIGTDD